ncbi:MAG: DUF4870 domain-containing protein [Phycisphaerales bacterium]|nr:DUF4870 domain-containing protein [Phycisphaerales bacterium]
MPASAMNEFSTNAQNRLVDHEATDAERNIAMWMHLSLLAYPFTAGLVFIAPLVLWLTRRDDSPFIDDHGKETLNFHLTLMLYVFALPILGGIVGLLLCGVGLIVTVPAAIALPYVLGIVGMIAASKAAHRGEYYRYPMSIRFLH